VQPGVVVGKLASAGRVPLLSVMEVGVVLVAAPVP